VPALGTLLGPRQPALRYQAIEALRRIDTDEAASLLWPHLGEEGDLSRKLQLAEFLGRHGFRGGYPYAIEHMSEPALRDQAVEALAAIREPKAIPELRRIWESSHDLAWNAAAIRALGRLGQAEITPRLLEIVRDLRDPLAAPALIALGDLGEDRALPSVGEGLASRNDEVVVAAARAARKLLARPGARGDGVRDRLATLLADPYATPNVRSEALDALVALDDPRLGTALAAAARDSGLEGNELLRRVEEQLVARKERLERK
jgi:HEAT repeat protein